MKKILIFFAVIALIACSKTNDNDAPIVITSIAINDIASELNVGDTYQMAVTTNPVSNIRPVWASSDTDVATVSSSGLLTIKSGGIADITATHELLHDTKHLIITESQNYTSFVFYHNVEPITPRSNGETNKTLNNCVIGYLADDNTYHKLAELGSLSLGDYSNEVRVFDNSITEIYLFFDEQSGLFRTFRFVNPFIIKKNKKNIFELETGLHIKWVDKDALTDYPQE